MRIAGLLFIAAYLPFAVSGGYIPTVLGTMSRTNGMGAWVGALLLASALVRIPEKLKLPAYTLVLSALIMVNRWDAGSWEYSYQIQLKAVEQAKEGDKEPPSWVPAYTGSAVVFSEAWDWPYALKVGKIK